MVGACGFGWRCIGVVATIGTLVLTVSMLLCPSILAQAGRFKLEADEDDGSYFIDRDGTCAAAVLRYLRGQHVYEPATESEADLLQSDAEYYKLPGLMDSLVKAEVMPKLPLLSKKQVKQIQEWCSGGLGKKKVEFEVLWRSSEHGDTVQE